MFKRDFSLKWFWDTKQEPVDDDEDYEEEDDDYGDSGTDIAIFF